MEILLLTKIPVKLRKRRSNRTLNRRRVDISIIPFVWFENETPTALTFEVADLANEVCGNAVNEEVSADLEEAGVGTADYSQSTDAYNTLTGTILEDLRIGRIALARLAQRWGTNLN